VVVGSVVVVVVLRSTVVGVSVVVVVFAIDVGGISVTSGVVEGVVLEEVVGPAAAVRG
jgi:hypothetical protein